MNEPRQPPRPTPSIAVVVRSWHDDSREQSVGCALWWWPPGGQLGQEAETGATIDALGLEDAPIGISIWEGIYVWVSAEDGPHTNPVGKYRAPTDEEWAKIREGAHPWEGFEYVDGAWRRG